jgi:hypothetical protein
VVLGHYYWDGRDDEMVLLGVLNLHWDRKNCIYDGVGIFR